MQNLADLLVTRSSAPLEGADRQLDTFVVYNQRRKVRCWLHSSRLH